MRPVIGPPRDDNAPRFLLRPTTELEESCLTYCDNLILIQSVREYGGREEEDFLAEWRRLLQVIVVIDL